MMPVDTGWPNANANHATLIAWGRPAQLARIRVGPIDVAVGPAAGRVDDVAMAQVLEKAGQAQRFHAARDDRRRRLHSEPFLVIGRAREAVAFDDVGNRLIVLFAFHLS